MSLINRDPNESKSQHLKIVFGVILVVGIAFAGSKIFNRSGETNNTNTSRVPSRDSSTLTAPSSPYQDPIERENRALAVTKQESFREQATAVLEALKVLDKEISLWEVEIEPLLFNTDGKWIASDEALVRYHQKLVAEERMVPVTVSSIRTKVDEMLTPVIQALRDPTELYVPSLELSKTLTKLHTDVYYGAKAYQKQRTQILAMVEDAKANGKQAEFTLQTAIARLEGEKVRMRAELIAQEEKKAEEEIAKRVAAVRRETLEKEAKAEEILLLERQKLADQKGVLEKKKLEEQRIKELAMDPSIQRDFAVFLAKSNNYLKTPKDFAYTEGVARYNVFKWKYNGKASVPNSYLVSMGVYDSFDNFVAVVTRKYGTVTYAGGKHSFYNDRPIWPTPKTREDWNKYRSQWDFFKRLAPFWIESGVLAK